MRLHRFISSFHLANDYISTVDERITHQIRSVLRLKIGDACALCDGNGKEAIARITNLGKKEIEFKIEKRSNVTAEPARAVTLYLALLKHEHFDLAVEKAVEAGVSVIIPVITDRTIKTGLKLERVQKIALEAAEQSGRGIVPRVEEAVDMTAAFEKARAHDANMFFEPGAPLWDGPGLLTSIGIFIGPEGGWSEEELARVASEFRFKKAGLGPRILRAETAAIVAAFLAAR